MENIVYIELLRRAAPLFHDIYYYKPSSRNKEVDFVVCEQGHIIDLIQVSYSIDAPKTLKRETDALIQASEKLHCNNLTLITRSETRDEVIDGKTIHIINIIEWLLS
jgi:predicted AAA+ superfamily ATPase